MVTEIQTWQIVEGKLKPIETSMAENDRKEREHLEQWLKSNPEIFGEDIAIIGEQVATKSGPLDFLGIDNSGNAVVIELKRDKLPREALVQAIDYASDVSEWEADRFDDICQSYSQQPLEDYLQEQLTDLNVEEIGINQVQRLLLVGFAIEEPLSRMIEWLSEKYSLGINAIVLNYVKTKSGDELLSRTVIIPEEVEKEKANKKKFVIEMSDEPGKYDEDELKKHLKSYLTKNLYSARRIRDYFLPILLEKGQLTREELKQEFVNRNAAEHGRHAGQFISLISTQLGHKWKDYLRQVILYEYPNYSWEKNNFKIKEGYEELVKSVLEELSEDKED